MAKHNSINGIFADVYWIYLIPDNPLSFKSFPIVNLTDRMIHSSEVAKYLK